MIAGRPARFLTLREILSAPGAGAPTRTICVPISAAHSSAHVVVDHERSGRRYTAVDPADAGLVLFARRDGAEHEDPLVRGEPLTGSDGWYMPARAALAVMVPWD